MFFLSLWNRAIFNCFFTPLKPSQYIAIVLIQREKAKYITWHDAHQAQPKLNCQCFFHCLENQTAATGIIISSELLYRATADQSIYTHVYSILIIESTLYIFISKQMCVFMCAERYPIWFFLCVYNRPSRSETTYLFYCLNRWELVSRAQNEYIWKSDPLGWAHPQNRDFWSFLYGRNTL